ncbi:MAG: NADH-quinone oxidoreductase subunit NuoH [Deltaproteobacteria bacterium]|nr:NADH-quinone oxidoreductase subunit NuoH [Deltaproteobacteria bacterium]
MSLVLEYLQNPWIHGLVFGGIVVTAMMVAAGFVSWFERKFAGRIQSRMGPTIVGPVGILQPLADGLKMMQKEEIVPKNADKFLFNIAPALIVFFALAIAAVIPFYPGMLASDLDVGVLYVLAFAGMSAFPIWVGAWASNNKYALLGGMRMVAQGISYEIPMVLSALIPVILAGSLSVSDIVKYQIEHGWFAIWPVGPGILAFIIFLLTALAEGNRIPFDIPEAESELVSGPTTEYTGMKFGLFAASEYVHSIATAGIASALFLGGWDGPFGIPVFWMVFKTSVLFLVITWVRWSLLRFRSDQLMMLCWKFLVPASLGLVMLAGVWVHIGG